MKPHKTDFYKEGYSRIEFCTVCGAEGELLQLECLGEVPNENQLSLFQQNAEKDIDNG